MEGLYNIETKRAITYSLLAHINNSKILSNGPLDLFVPIVKKCLHIITCKGEFKGENIKEISEIVDKEYGIDIPIPVMRNILKIIVKEINSEKEIVFSLNKDDSFWIKKYVFVEYDQHLEDSKKEVENLQYLFKEFCRVNNVSTQNSSIIHFIEKNKMMISYYLANKIEPNGNDYTIEAKFVDYFRNSSPQIYEQIKSIYLGSILTSYLDYTPSDLKVNVDLLFDTNFIISLLDLNTPESTYTCKKLLEICEKMGFSFHVLSDTIYEARGLLQYKIDNFDNSILQQFVNKEDIYNACNRLHYTKTDLQRIIDKLESLIESYKINVIIQTDVFKHEARYSNEYKTLKEYRYTERSALHDAMCIMYVKRKRNNKRPKDFNKINCWWVNNSISHDYESEDILPIDNYNKNQLFPEEIKVDDLLNILWLSSPHVIDNGDIIDMGLTSLIAFTLNKDLPKSRIIKELDDNIQKYKNEDITDQDVYLLSTRIANGQLKDIEEINNLAQKDVCEFNQRVKEEANKQLKIEIERGRTLEAIVEKFSKVIKDLQDHKKNIDKKSDEKIGIAVSQLNDRLIEISNKDFEIENLKAENKLLKSREYQAKKDVFIKNELKKWRYKSLRSIIIVGLIFVIVFVACYFYCGFHNLESFLSYKIISIFLSILLFFIETFLLKGLYDKYYNYSNITAFIHQINFKDNFE